MRTATPILFALSAVFVLAASPGWTEERACRPVLEIFGTVPAMRMPSQRQHLRSPKELVGLVCRMAITVPEPR